LPDGVVLDDTSGTKEVKITLTDGTEVSLINLTLAQWDLLPEGFRPEAKVIVGEWKEAQPHFQTSADPDLFTASKISAFLTAISTSPNIDATYGGYGFQLDPAVLEMRVDQILQANDGTSWNFCDWMSNDAWVAVNIPEMPIRKLLVTDVFTPPCSHNPNLLGYTNDPAPAADTLYHPDAGNLTRVIYDLSVKRNGLYKSSDNLTLYDKYLLSANPGIEYNKDTDLIFLIMNEGGTDWKILTDELSPGAEIIIAENGNPGNTRQIFAEQLITDGYTLPADVIWAKDIAGNDIPNPTFNASQFLPSHNLKNTDKSDSVYATDGNFYSYRDLMPDIFTFKRKGNILNDTSVGRIFWGKDFYVRDLEASIDAKKISNPGQLAYCIPSTGKINRADVVECITDGATDYKYTNYNVMIRQKPQVLIDGDWISLSDLSSAILGLEGSIDGVSGLLIPDVNPVEDKLPDTVKITGLLEINLKKWTDRRVIESDPILSSKRPEKFRCTWEYEDKDTWQSLTAVAQMFIRSYPDILDKSSYNETARLADPVNQISSNNGVYTADYIYTLQGSDTKNNDIDCRLRINDGFDETPNRKSRYLTVPDSSLQISPSGIIDAPQGVDKTLLVTQGENNGFIDIDGDLPDPNPGVGVNLIDATLLRSGILQPYSCFATTCNSVYSPAADQTIFTDPMDPETYANLWQTVTNVDGTRSEDGMTYLNVQPTPQMQDWTQAQQALETMPSYLSNSSSGGQKKSYTFYLPKGADKLVVEAPSNPANYCGKPIPNAPKMCQIEDITTPTGTDISENCMVCGIGDADPATAEYCVLVSSWPTNAKTPGIDYGGGGYTEQALFTDIDRSLNAKMVCKIDESNAEGGMNNPQRFDYCVDLIQPTPINELTMVEPDGSYGVFGADPALGDPVKTIDFKGTNGILSHGDILHADNSHIASYCSYNEPAPGGWSSNVGDFCLPSPTFYDAGAGAGKSFACQVRCSNGQCPLSYYLGINDTSVIGQYRYKASIGGVAAPTFGTASITAAGGIQPERFVIYVSEDETDGGGDILVQFQNNMMGWTGEGSDIWMTSIDLQHKDPANDAILELPPAPFAIPQDTVGNAPSTFTLAIEATNAIGPTNKAYLKPGVINDIKSIPIILTGTYVTSANVGLERYTPPMEGKIIIIPKAITNKAFTTHTTEKIGAATVTNIDHINDNTAGDAYDIPVNWPLKEILVAKVDHSSTTKPAAYPSKLWGTLEHDGGAEITTFGTNFTTLDCSINCSINHIQHATTRYHDIGTYVDTLTTPMHEKYKYRVRIEIPDAEFSQYATASVVHNYISPLLLGTVSEVNPYLDKIALNTLLATESFSLESDTGIGIINVRPRTNMLTNDIYYPIKGKSPPVAIPIETNYGVEYDHAENYRPIRYEFGTFGKGVLTPSGCDAAGTCTGSFLPTDGVYGQDTKFVTYVVNDTITATEIQSDGFLNTANDLTSRVATTMTFDIRPQPYFIFVNGPGGKQVANAGERVNATGYLPSETAISSFVPQGSIHITGPEANIFDNEYRIDTADGGEYKGVSIRIDPVADGFFEYWDQDASAWAAFEDQNATFWPLGDKRSKLLDITDNDFGKTWKYGKCSNLADSNHGCKFRFVPNVGYTGTVTTKMQLAVFDYNLKFTDETSGDYFWSNEETLEMQIRPAPKTQQIATNINRKLVIENEPITLNFNPSIIFTADGVNNDYSYKHVEAATYGTNWRVNRIEATITDVDGSAITTGHDVTTVCATPLVNGDCTLTYTPKTNFSGPVDIEYTVVIDDLVLGSELRSNTSDLFFTVFPRPIAYGRKAFLPVKLAGIHDSNLLLLEKGDAATEAAEADPYLRKGYSHPSGVASDIVIDAADVPDKGNIALTSWSCDAGGMCSKLYDMHGPYDYAAGAGAANNTTLFKYRTNVHPPASTADVLSDLLDYEIEFVPRLAPQNKLVYVKERHEGTETNYGTGGLTRIDLTLDTVMDQGDERLNTGYYYPADQDDAGNNRSKAKAIIIKGTSGNFDLVRGDAVDPASGANQTQWNCAADGTCSIYLRPNKDQYTADGAPTSFTIDYALISHDDRINDATGNPVGDDLESEIATITVNVRPYPRASITPVVVAPPAPQAEDQTYDPNKNFNPATFTGDTYTYNTLYTRDGAGNTQPSLFFKYYANSGGPSDLKGGDLNGEDLIALNDAETSEEFQCFDTVDGDGKSTSRACTNFNFTPDPAYFTDATASNPVIIKYKVFAWDPFLNEYLISPAAGTINLHHVPTILAKAPKIEKFSGNVAHDYIHAVEEIPMNITFSKCTLPSDPNLCFDGYYYAYPNDGDLPPNYAEKMQVKAQTNIAVETGLACGGGDPCERELTCDASGSCLFTLRANPGYVSNGDFASFQYRVFVDGKWSHTDAEAWEEVKVQVHARPQIQELYKYGVEGSDLVFKIEKDPNLLDATPMGLFSNAAVTPDPLRIKIPDTSGIYANATFLDTTAGDAPLTALDAATQASSYIV
jgi:hypothetical protein